MASDYPYYIVTRLGIGIADMERSIFRVRLLAETLYRSLVAQTSQDFSWLIVADQRIHPQAESELRQLISSHPNFEIHKQDPLKTKSMTPMSATVKERIQSSPFAAISRIDDDDVVSTEYVSTVRSVLRAEAPITAPFAVTFPHGLHVQPHRSVLAAASIPWLAPSIALLVSTAGTELFTPYSIKHANVGVEAERRGGKSMTCSDTGPMWAYVRRPTSNSAEQRDLRRAAGEVLAPSELDAKLAKFGVTEGWCQRLQALYASEPPLVPLASAPDLPLDCTRIMLKVRLLQSLKELEYQQSHSDRNVDYEALVGALASAFYSF